MDACVWYHVLVHRQSFDGLISKDRLSLPQKAFIASHHSARDETLWPPTPSTVGFCQFWFWTNCVHAVTVWVHIFGFFRGSAYESKHFLFLFSQLLINIWLYLFYLNEYLLGCIYVYQACVLPHPPQVFNVPRLFENILSLCTAFSSFFLSLVHFLWSLFAF